MYANQPINGAHLPDKTLCLTYDDGPGEHTMAIAQFLYEQGIKAAFFVVGKYAIEQQPVLARLQQMGHTIGNHTYDTPLLLNTWTRNYNAWTALLSNFYSSCYIFCSRHVELVDI